MEYLDTEFLSHIMNSGLDDSADILGQDVVDIIKEILNQPITEEELTYYIQRLKNRKTPGHDGISCEFLKHAEEILVPPLLDLYNFILKSGDFPSQWSQGIINPLYKNGDKTKPENYRKITLLVTLGKLFESILNGRLVFKNSVFSQDDEFQAGFRGMSRTVDNAYILYSLIQKQKFLGKPLYVCFVDFTKAFDFVNRDALFYKLKQRGVCGEYLDVIKNMLKKATTKVRWRAI